MDLSSRFDNKIALCEDIIGYTFNNKVLCAEALNTAADAKSVCVIGGFFKKIPKNNSLAIYGGSAATLHLCKLWRELNLEPGDWSNIRNGMLSNANLAQAGRACGLDACVNTNGGTTAISDGMVARTVEAVLGAICEDSGLDVLATVMDRLGLTQHALLQSVPSWLPQGYAIRRQ